MAGHAAGWWCRGQDSGKIIMLYYIISLCPDPVYTLQINSDIRLKFNNFIYIQMVSYIDYKTAKIMCKLMTKKLQNAWKSGSSITLLCIVCYTDEIDDYTYV